MAKIIKVKGLKKSYGKVAAVKGIDLSVEEGDLFAFLGTNGAGKSTTIDILSTLISSDEGEIIIDGHKMGREDQDIRKKIGVVFQNSVLDDLLTIRENLLLRGSFYSMKSKVLKEKVNRVAEITDIVEILDRPYGKLSGGQRRRADIARALIHTPKILFLDEPTTGLDPKTRMSIWETIINMQKELKTTVFLTTHYMEEAANADYISIISKGNIVEEGTPASLKSKYTKEILKIYSIDNSIKDYLNKNEIQFEQKNDVLIVQTKNGNQALDILNGIKDFVTDFEVIKGTIDDAFLRIISDSEGGIIDAL